MDELYTEASLSDTVLYHYFNSHGEMTQTILTAIKNSIKIDASYIEEQLIQMKRLKMGALVDDVIGAFNNNDIVLLYSNVKKIPQAFPFFAAKSNGKVTVFIFLNNYSKIVNVGRDKHDTLDIGMKDLYALMESAYIAFKYSMYTKGFIRSTGLMKICAQIYVQMFMRIFNREYALVSDRETYDKVSFVIGKFFLANVWGSQNSEINYSYAKGILDTTNINSQMLMSLDDEYESHQIHNIEELISFIKTISPRLETLNLRYFSERWMNTFKPSALFGIESITYFLFIVEATMIGSFLVNQPIINDILKNTKGINIFYPELVKAI